MKTLGHLESYQVTLTALAPLFIGSGNEISKKDYIYDKRANKIYVPKMNEMIAFLEARGLLEDYLADVISGPQTLQGFLTNKQIRFNDYKSFIDYTLDDVNNTIDDKALKGIQQFMRDGYNMLYIPGSSLKGAIRTALLNEKLLNNTLQGQKTVNSLRNSTKSERLDLREIARQGTQLESDLLNTLPVNRERVSDAVNSVMKGISISDSQPINPKQLILIQKIDVHTDGNKKPLPIFRECLAPQTQATFTLTIDKTLAEVSGITIDDIKSAIEQHYQWQQKIFVDKFDKLANENCPAEALMLYLGGGAGFISKTMLHAVLGEKDGLDATSKILVQQFRKHKHDKDVKFYRVSPHTKKMTQYKGQYYQMGLCGLEID